MKKTIKGFVLGLIIATMLMSTVLGAGVKKTIEVAFNSINLTINGEKVDADTILYEGTTYVPLRATGEMLGKDVGWNQATNTASINDKVGEKPIDKPISKDGLKLFEDDKVKISYLKTTTNGMEFMVENKTDIVLTISADTLSINGLNISEMIIMIKDVSPKSKGRVVAPFDTSNYDSNVHTISGQFKVYDLNDFDFFSIPFVNVKVN